MRPSVESIEIDWAHTTHSPCLLKVCLIYSAIGLALVILTVFFRRLHYRGAPLIFCIMGILTARYYLLLTFPIFRFGILWPAADGSEVLYNGTHHIVTRTRAADYIYLVAWYAVSSLLALGARHWLRIRERK